MIVARFRVHSIEHRLNSGDPHHVVKLSAVCGPGNEQWSKYTPSGDISITITNPEAIEKFKLGEEYAVTFSPVPKRLEGP